MSLCFLVLGLEVPFKILQMKMGMDHVNSMVAGVPTGPWYRVETLYLFVE